MDTLLEECRARARHFVVANMVRVPSCAARRQRGAADNDRDVVWRRVNVQAGLLPVVPELLLARAKEAHITPGLHWTEELAWYARRVSRSVRWGMGASWRSAALDVFRIAELAGEALPAPPVSSPIVPRRLLIACSMFLLRVIELAVACWRHIRIAEARVDGLLPVSKTDIEALEVTLTWGCRCVGKDTPCAYHAIKAQRAEIEHRFMNRNHEELPVFPCTTGDVPSKQIIIKARERGRTNRRGLRGRGGRAQVRRARHQTQRREMPCRPGDRPQED